MTLVDSPVFARIAGIVEVVTGTPATKVAAETTFVDIGLESLAYIDLVLEVEAAFDLDIDEDHAEKLTCIGDLVELVDRLVQEGPRAGAGAPPTNALCYLATPYSAYRMGLDRAFIDAAALAARLLVAGVRVYSPIAHTHPLAIYGHLDPKDHSIWMPFDETMMAKADVLLVAHMEGWKDSIGIAHEIDFFERAAKPIFDLDPRSLHMAQRQAPGVAVEFDPILGGVLS